MANQKGHARTGSERINKRQGEARREARKHRDMKSCKKCFQEFDDSKTSDDNPARDLGDIFVSDMGNIGIEDISPKCREELGIISIISFTHY